jgi:hypothetical protein
LRVFFVGISVFILVGIWLSGFDQVHWFIYLPPAFLLFAAISGICPGLWFLGKLGIPDSNNPPADDASARGT